MLDYNLYPVHPAQLEEASLKQSRLLHLPAVFEDPEWVFQGMWNFWDARCDQSQSQFPFYPSPLPHKYCQFIAQ